MAFTHWILTPPRRAHTPSSNRIEKWEIQKPSKQRRELKQKRAQRCVESWGSNGLRSELKSLGIKSPANTVASMREVLLRVGRTGSTVGELRAREKGRPDRGGKLQPATGDTCMCSECLALMGRCTDDGELVGEANDACELSAD
mmetsp:Transcript_4440/g.8906  ORF Transcript_4440/g.8906 Transcript_4440/m.8906 type:complete len:144 (-) Transcript_4440:436-867(-)